MAHLGKKGDLYCVRFRFRGKEYKKSLKTRDESSARAACHLIEVTLHRLHTGQLQIPDHVDPGDYVVSGGTLTEPVCRPAPRAPEPPRPTSYELVDRYCLAHRDLHAPSYLSSQAMHLRHLLRHLGPRAGERCDSVSFRDLDDYLRARLGVRHANTAERERITLLQFYKWSVRQGYLEISPASGLAPIKGGEDRPPFRTIAEIEGILERGGLDDEQQLDLWECLYLSPPEIAELLATVRHAEALRALGYRAAHFCEQRVSARAMAASVTQCWW